MTMSIVYSQLSGHKWYVYIDKSLFISRVLFMYFQEMFLITNDACVYFDKSLFTSKVWKIVDWLTK